jgi:hypothetical protein
MVDPFDNEYRAIGRYVTLFSTVVAYMRNMLATRIAGLDEGSKERDLVELAFGGLTAEPIASAFFAASRTLVEFDDVEKAIEARLRKTVFEEIKRRNDLLHGDWVFHQLSFGGPKAMLLRVKAGSVKDSFLLNEYGAGQIEGICDEVDLLSEAIWMFAGITLKPHGDNNPHELPARLRDALEIVDGRVVCKPEVEIPSSIRRRQA